MIKVLKVVLRIIAILLVFPVPIIWLASAYLKKETEIREIEAQTIEIVNWTINPFIMLVIYAAIAVFVLWIIVSLLIKWWDKIKKEPFGYHSVMTFGIILIALFLTSIILMGNTIVLVEANADVVVSNLKAFKGDFQWCLGFVVTGFLINLMLIFWD